MFGKIAFAARKIISTPATTKVAEEVAVFGNSKIAATAKAAFKGSEVQRYEKSGLKLNEFYNNTKDVFVKNSEISKEQIEKELKKTYPGINIKLATKTDVKDEAALEPIFDESKKRIIGYEMQLPFKEKEGKLFLHENDAGHMYHEISHLGDFVYNHKLTSRFNTKGLNEKFSGFDQRVGSYDKFYRSDLYVDEFVGNSRMDEAKIVARQDKFRKGVEELFNNPKVSSEEKIEVLQDWRNLVKTELAAFPNGYKYDNKLEIEQAIKKYKGIKNLPADLVATKAADMEKFTTQTIYNSFSFADKKKIIEEILKKEIAKVRENSAKIFPTAKAPL